jgi:hypothetical protein
MKATVFWDVTPYSLVEFTNLSKHRTVSRVAKIDMGEI